MQQYVDDMGKMALALTSAQLAKDEAVKEFGAKEELALHFLAWMDNALVAICQMSPDTAKMDASARFARCKSLCEILRLRMWCTALTMVSEGYCSLDASKTNGIELSSAFGDPAFPIHECVTVSHVSIDEHTNHIAPVSMVAAPYSVSMDQSVNWKDILVYPEKATQHTKQTKYPMMLHKTMQIKPDESIDDETLNSVQEQIESLGFVIHHLS